MNSTYLLSLTFILSCQVWPNSFKFDLTPSNWPNFVKFDLFDWIQPYLLSSTMSYLCTNIHGLIICAQRSNMITMLHFLPCLSSSPYLLNSTLPSRVRSNLPGVAAPGPLYVRGFALIYVVSSFVPKGQIWFSCCVSFPFA